MMKKYAYAGWIYENTVGDLCLNPCPQLNSHEPPTLAELIDHDWKSGETVSLSFLVLPDQLRGKWIGELTLDDTGVLVGCYDVSEALKAHVGKLGVILIAEPTDSGYDSSMKIAETNFPTVSEIQAAVNEHVAAECGSEWPEDDWMDVGENWSVNIWLHGEERAITVYYDYMEAGKRETDLSCGIHIPGP